MENHYNTLNDWVKVKGLKVKQRTLWHYSVYNDSVRVDLFPTNMRFHIVNGSHKGERGDFPDSLEDRIIFLETIFEL